MCLPHSLLTKILAISACYLMGFSLFSIASYFYKQSTEPSLHIAPVTATLIVFLIPGISSIIFLKKRSIVSGLTTFLFSLAILLLVMQANKFVSSFFDISKGCEELSKMNPVYSAFIDKNLDYKFKESSSLLCSKKCPCKWVNNTQVLQRNLQNFFVDKERGAVSILDCPSFLNQNSLYLKLMLDLETQGCSGYCQKNDRFSITNINLGAPKSSCFDFNRKQWKNTLDGTFFGLEILCYFLYLLCLSTCCIMCKSPSSSTFNQKQQAKYEQKISQQAAIENMNQLDSHNSNNILLNQSPQVEENHLEEQDEQNKEFHKKKSS